MTDPWAIQIPIKLREDPESSFYFDYLGGVIRDLIAQTETDKAAITDLEARVTALEP